MTSCSNNVLRLQKLTQHAIPQNLQPSFLWGPSAGDVMSYSKFLSPHNCRQKVEIRGKKNPSACFVICDAPL